MQKLKTLLLGVILTAVASCSTFGPKPEVVYHRPDVKVSKESKLIVFPVMNFQGETKDISKGLSSSVVSGWSSFKGTKQAIPAGEIIVKVAKKTGFDLMNLVKAMDDVSYLEQTLKKDRKFKRFISQVTNQLGDYDFAMTLVRGNQNSYEAGQPVRLHLGYFNTKTLTWKWITKIQDKKGMIGNWDTAYSTLVSNSFDSLEEIHLASRNLASE